MLLKKLLILVAVMISAIHIAGQDFPSGNFDHYTTEKGLSHNSVTGIAQDASGYVWVATASGLNRYNGTRFIQFHSNDDSLSLAAEELTGMCWLDKNRLAVYTSGLHILDTRTGKTHNLFIPSPDKQ